jgi:hypothetical protein
MHPYVAATTSITDIDMATTAIETWDSYNG